MGIVMGLDVHRQQITFDLLDTQSGEVRRGRIQPASRHDLRAWLAPYRGRDVRAALEATTGWRYVVEELQAVGAEVHLAEPCETRTARGRKRRPKTDRVDARHLRVLVQRGDLPESWIPPAWVQELRTQVRLRHTLVAERSAWKQRIQATLFHHGAPPLGSLISWDGRQRLAAMDLPPAAHDLVTRAQRLITTLSGEIEALDAQLRPIAREHPAGRALGRLYGVGPVVAVTLLAELGDARRFRNGGQVVRFAGLDITVEQSDTTRRPGRLSRQGAPVLRWAAVEAAQCASRSTAPDHATYQRLKARHGHNRACLQLARKLLRRAAHELRSLPAAALQPAA